MAFTFPSISSVMNAITSTAGAIGQTAQANYNLAKAYTQPTVNQITAAAKPVVNQVVQSRPVAVPVSLAQTAGANINLAKAAGNTLLQNLSGGMPTQTPTYNATNQTWNQPYTATNVNQGYANSIQPTGIQTTQTIPGVQSPTFDYTSAQTKAYESLKDFYDKLLSFSGGRMDLAKRMLEYTYTQGMREATQENEQAAKELALATPKETANLLSDLNKRGVYNSGFGAQDRESLKSSQDLRALAIQRALENKTSRLETQKGFGLEEATRTAEEDKFNLERQRRNEADTMATRQYGMQSDKYGAQLGVAGQEEQRRVQGLANEATTGVVGGGTTSTSTKTNTAGKTFEQYMAETGRQGELDAATKGGTTNSTDYYTLRKKYGF